MDVEIPVLAGYLNLPTQSGFSINRISKKKPCHRYCLLFKSSRHGIERLEICESKEDKNPKIITLENCVKITQEPTPANLIQIVKKTGTLTLNTLNDEDLKEWLNALQMVAFRDKSNAHGSQAACIEEDNDLYCSSYGDGLFIVTLIPSDTSIRCNIESKAYMLDLTATELQLKSAEDINVVIAKWPYRFIRKYGYRDGKFTFEAGRKCSTGEGVFTLDHTNPQEVFRCMSAKMKSMKKLITGDSLNNGGMESCENQLSVAASMEAGSRSPLPPSPSNQIGGEFEINSTQSCMSLRGFLSSSDSLNNFPSATTTNTSTNSTNNTTNNSPSGASGVSNSSKHIPNKPPRKLPSSLDKLIVTTLPLPLPSPSTQTPSANTNIISNTPTSIEINQNCDKHKKFQNYEPVSITTSSDPNKTVGSTVILKPLATPEPARKVHITSIPPDLPVRNDTAKSSSSGDREYECIETITNAWKTLGVGDVRHTERIMPSDTNDNDLIDFMWKRPCPVAFKESPTLLQGKTPKIIDIDIGEGMVESAGSNDDYDCLNFLSPNNKSSSGYKTIVKVTSPNNRLRCSSPNPSPLSNDYELIANTEIQSYRKADDAHLGYGILRKSTNTANGLETVTTTCNTGGSMSAIISLPNNNNSSTTTTTTTTTTDVQPLDNRNYNGLYTIVSKPKRV